MAQHTLRSGRASIRQMCQYFGVSATCCHYHLGIANQRNRGFSLRLRYDWLGRHLYEAITEVQEHATLWD